MSDNNVVPNKKGYKTKLKNQYLLNNQNKKKLHDSTSITSNDITNPGHYFGMHTYSG